MPTGYPPANGYQGQYRKSKNSTFTVWKLGSGVCFTTPLKPPAGQASPEPFLCLSGKAERAVP